MRTYRYTRAWNRCVQIRGAFHLDLSIRGRDTAVSPHNANYFSDSKPQLCTTTTFQICTCNVAEASQRNMQVVLFKLASLSQWNAGDHKNMQFTNFIWQIWLLKNRTWTLTHQFEIAQKEISVAVAYELAGASDKLDACATLPTPFLSFPPQGITRGSLCTAALLPMIHTLAALLILPAHSESGSPADLKVSRIGWV